ncbi:MAG: hypothetical protein V4675_03855 [Verrucomicrobiota bacterium]
MKLSLSFSAPQPQRHLRLAVWSLSLVMGMGGIQAQDKPAPKSPAAEAPGQASSKKEADRFISMVILTKGPQDLKPSQIAKAVSEGTGTKVAEKDIAHKEAYHLVTVGPDKFIVNSVAEPYFEDAEKLAAELKFHNLGDSIKTSKGWVSVDWVAQDDKSDIKTVYQMIGRMVAKLGIQDIIAVYSPDLDEFALWTPENIQGLESDDPLAVFDHESHAPADKTSSPPAGADATKPGSTPTPKPGDR